MEEHNHAVTSNTDECFETFLEHKLIGIIQTKDEENYAVTTMVFDCGCGLTISAYGGFWTERRNKIRKTIDAEKKRLEQVRDTIDAVMKLAGDLPR